MKELKKLLKGVSDSYEDFVTGIMAVARHDEGYVDAIKKYIKDNPMADSSDITLFVMGLPGYSKHVQLIYDHHYHRRYLINSVMRYIIPSKTYRKYLADKYPYLTEYEAAWLTHQVGLPARKEMDVYGMIAALTTDKKLEKALVKILGTYFPMRDICIDEASYRIQPYFDDKFIACPNPFHAGDIVKYKPARKKYHIGVVTFEDSLDEMKEKGVLMDASDASLAVDWLNEKGEFFHEHICPVHLDYYALAPGNKRYDKIKAHSYEVQKEARS